MKYFNVKLSDRDKVLQNKHKMSISPHTLSQRPLACELSLRDLNAFFPAGDEDVSQVVLQTKFLPEWPEA